MRITVDLDEALFKQAQELTGLRTKAATLDRALRELIARENARRLAALGGSDPTLRAAPRRRPRNPG
jgi:Arc/MetJ family transcription regulator